MIKIDFYWNDQVLLLNDTEVNIILQAFIIENEWWQNNVVNLKEKDKIYYLVFKESYSKWNCANDQNPSTLISINDLYFAIRTLVNIIGWKTIKDRGWPDYVNWAEISAINECKNKIINFIQNHLNVFLKIDGGIKEMEENTKK